MHYFDLMARARESNTSGEEWTVFTEMNSPKESLEFTSILLEEAAKDPVKEETYGDVMVTIAKMEYHIGKRPFFLQGWPVNEYLKYFKVVSVWKETGYSVITIYPISYEVRFSCQIVFTV